MQIIDLLNKSEFIECNETESIADYLLKQRVISNKQYHEIINTKPVKLKNKLLIEVLQSNSDDELNESTNIYGLFVNALRYAGCHYMANILDIEEPLLGNKDNNNTRKKGQISVFVQVSAVQIKAKHLITRQTSQISEECGLQGNNNSIWLDKKSYSTGISDQLNNFTTNTKKTTFFSPFLCCFFRKKRHPTHAYGCTTYVVDKGTNNNNQIEIDRGRQVKIDILTEKSVKFYTLLNTTTSLEREALIKYFEQSHQILVFDTKFDDEAMIVTVICTKHDTLTALQNLLQSGQLEKDFNHLLLSKSMFEILDVKDIKLSINILPDELMCAIQELDLTKKKRS